MAETPNLRVCHRNILERGIEGSADRPCLAVVPIRLITLLVVETAEEKDIVISAARLFRDASISAGRAMTSSSQLGFQLSRET